VPMRTTSPQDRKAIEAWVSEHDAGADLVASLSSLDDGEGWVWSPHWLHILKKVRFRRRRTFDSGATPTFGGVRPAARAAEVDLAALKDRMAATIERAETNDLIGRLEELARDLTSAMPNDADREDKIQVDLRDDTREGEPGNGDLEDETEPGYVQVLREAARRRDQGPPDRTSQNSFRASTGVRNPVVPVRAGSRSRAWRTHLRGGLARRWHGG